MYVCMYVCRWDDSPRSWLHALWYRAKYLSGWYSQRSLVKTLFLFFIWMSYGVIYGMAFEHWSFIQSVYYVITACASGGLLGQAAALTHTCTYIHINTHAYIHTLTYILTHTHTCTPVHIRKHIHTYTHIYIYTYIHKYIQIRTYTLKYMNTNST